MPMPQFRPDGWLPDGHWAATWDEVEATFGGEVGSRRAELTTRLVEWRDAARRAGLSGRIILDGSYISVKEMPGDIDAIFVFDDRSAEILKGSPEARSIVNYVENKKHGLGDIFVYAGATARQYPSWCRLDGFDYDRVSGDPKGVVEVPV